MRLVVGESLPTILPTEKTVVKRARGQAPLVDPLPRTTRNVSFAAHEDHKSAKQEKPGTKGGNVWETSTTADHKNFLKIKMKRTSLVFNIEKHWFVQDLATQWIQQLLNKVEYGSCC